MGAFKASEPDGFHAYFYRTSWQIIGEDITKFIQIIFITETIPQPLNHTKIILIPKNTNPELVTLFHPISLCNSLYKLIAKILVTQLKPFLNYFIHPGPAQLGYVLGRRTSDSYVLVQELIHYLQHKKGKQGCFATKIDLDKVYDRDRLNWHFIHESLIFYKFTPSTIDLIMNCVTTTTLKVLWNGKEGPILPKQGDLLSPYLFIICLNRLTNDGPSYLYKESEAN